MMRSDFESAQFDAPQNVTIIALEQSDEDTGSAYFTNVVQAVFQPWYRRRILAVIVKEYGAANASFAEDARTETLAHWDTARQNVTAASKGASTGPSVPGEASSAPFSVPRLPIAGVQ